MRTRLLDYLRRNARLGWWFAAALVLPVLLIWSFDREPPFYLTGPVKVTNARAGDSIEIDAPVERSLSRGCDATFTRYFIDAHKFRHDFNDKERHMTAARIAEMDVEMDRRLRLKVPVPHAAAPGPATYNVDLLYYCNPLHHRSPIEVAITIPFEVLP